MTTPVYDPRRMPEVAREDMNAVHAEEIELVNRLGALVDAVAAGAATPQQLTEALHEWRVHTQAHFDNEHRIMEESGFPAYPVHRAEHERVLAQLDALIEAWEQTQEIEPVRAFLFETWPAWFDNHVNTMDFATAHFASTVGQRPF